MERHGNAGVASMARRDDTARLMLIGTYRCGDAMRGHPLRKVVDELIRQQQLNSRSTRLPDGSGCCVILPRAMGRRLDHTSAGGSALPANRWASLVSGDAG
jgi:hypothetical protein